MKCLSGFAEVPYQVPPWSLPDAPRMPKNKSKEASLVPALKARLYRQVLVAKCLPGGAEGPYQAISPPKMLYILGTRLEGTFGTFGKCRLNSAWRISCANLIVAGVLQSPCVSAVDVLLSCGFCTCTTCDSNTMATSYDIVCAEEHTVAVPTHKGGRGE